MHTLDFLWRPGFELRGDNKVKVVRVKCGLSVFGAITFICSNATVLFAKSCTLTPSLPPYRYCHHAVWMNDHCGGDHKTK